MFVVEGLATNRVYLGKDPCFSCRIGSTVPVYPLNIFEQHSSVEFLPQFRCPHQRIQEDDHFAQLRARTACLGPEQLLSLLF